ncbi:MAG: ATP-binding cassette domain-containing protein, partial [Aquamicrobium sp.]|nr:ATP-binding cassette domain-containing protein [Aquamicrobium sp.]
MLKVSSLTMRFDGLVAVNAVDMAVAEGEILGLIGPNGAGKTTLFNVVAGVFPPTAGTVTFAGMRIDGRSPDQICKLGLARTFQIPQVFHSMTVLESIAVGAYLRHRNVAAARERAGAVAATLR